MSVTFKGLHSNVRRYHQLNGILCYIKIACSAFSHKDNTELSFKIFFFCKLFVCVVKDPQSYSAMSMHYYKV